MPPPAAPAVGLKDTADRLHNMASSAERMDKAMEGVDVSFGSIVRSMVGYDVARGLLDKLIFKSDVWLGLTRKVNAAYKESGVTRGPLTVLSAYTALSIDLYRKTEAFNQSLIEANVATEHRTRLLTETLRVQTELGANFELITQAAQALVHYGMDEAQTFNENLRLVVQMQQGLGVSVEASAQLATIVERQLKGSFKDVASIIANIVDKTSLAGNEAARMANNIATIMSRIQPDAGRRGFAGALEVVSRYEDMLKKVSGTTGGFTQLLSYFATLQGQKGLGAVGVSAELLKTEQGIRLIFDRFREFSEARLGQAGGGVMQRIAALELLSRTFDGVLSPDQINAMVIALKSMQPQMAEQISLEARWREQLHDANMGLRRLLNAMIGLMTGAMQPLVILFAKAVNVLADWVEWLVKTPGVVRGLQIALMAGLGAAIIGIRSLIFHLFALAAASRVGRFMGTDILRGIFSRKMVPTDSLDSMEGVPVPRGGFSFAGFWAGLRTVLTSIFLNPWTYLIAAVGGLVYWAHKSHAELKRIADQTAGVNRMVLSSRDLLEAKQRARIEGGLSGDFADSLKGFQSLMRDTTEKFSAQGYLSSEGIRKAFAWIDEQKEAVQFESGRIAAGLLMLRKLGDRTAEERAYEERHLRFQQQIAAAAEAQKEALRESQRQYKEKMLDTQFDVTKSWSDFLDRNLGIDLQQFVPQQ